MKRSDRLWLKYSLMALSEKESQLEGDTRFHQNRVLWLKDIRLGPYLISSMDKFGFVMNM